VTSDARGDPATFSRELEDAARFFEKATALIETDH